jgi:serine/threonine-protein kinase
MVGTPEYMSPEQVEGEEADQRSDIYSLGVVLYEMATGRLPFEGESSFSIAMKHKGERPKDPKELNAQIPEDLNLLILKCIAKDKEKRYQNIDELLSELNNIEKEITTAESAIPRRKPERRTQRKYFRPFNILATLLLIAIICITGYYIISRIQHKEKPGIETISQSLWKNSIAVLPFRDLSPQKDQAHLCFGMANAINDRLTQLGDLKVSATRAVERYYETEKSPKEIGQELGVMNILEGSVQKEEDTIRVRAELINTETSSQLWSQTYQRERERIFDVQDEISASIAEALKVKLSPDSFQALETNRPKNIEAYEYTLKGNHYVAKRYVISLSEEDFEVALSMYEKALEADPNYALAYTGLMNAYETRFVLAGGRERDRELVQQYAETAYKLNPKLSETITAMGYAYFRRGAVDKAFQYYKRAMEINPNGAGRNFLVGLFYKWQGMYHKAIEYFSKSAELDPFYPIAIAALAMSYHGVGEFEKAEVYLGKTLEIDPDSPLYLCCNTVNAITLEKYNQAEESLEREEKINPGSSGVLYTRALLHARKGEREQALALIEDPSVYSYAAVYSLLGMKDEAINAIKSTLLKREGIEGSTVDPLLYLTLTTNPFFENLRDDSRFKEIVKEQKKIYEERLKKYGDL